MKDERKDFIPKKLQQIRLASKMTQSKLAKVLNVSRSCLANYETGNRSPDNDILKAMANFYNVESTYFTKQDTKLLSTKQSDAIVDAVLNEIIITGSLSLQDISICSRIAIYEYYNFLLEQNPITNENIS